MRNTTVYLLCPVHSKAWMTIEAKGQIDVHKCFHAYYSTAMMLVRQNMH
jgi:hypothetical protein